MEKTDCFYYDNLTGCCKKGLPETRCEIEGCVCFTKSVDPLVSTMMLSAREDLKIAIERVKEGQIKMINEAFARALISAAQHLSERVDQYLVQGCSRAELKAANDA